MSDFKGIYDTSTGQCDAHVTIAGEDFRCDLAVDHNGWAHSSKAAESIWTLSYGLPTAVTA